MIYIVSYDFPELNKSTESFGTLLDELEHYCLMNNHIHLLAQGWLRCEGGRQ